MRSTGLRLVLLMAWTAVLWTVLPGAFSGSPSGALAGSLRGSLAGSPSGSLAGSLRGSLPGALLPGAPPGSLSGARFGAALALRALTAEAKSAARTGTAVHVSDGDTVVVRFGSTQERIRLLGIDAPESSQEPWGPMATRFLSGLVAGKTVRVETDVQTRDRYGRTLGYVFVGDTHANLELVRQGYAMLYTSPPNVRHSEAFLAAQREARAAGRNIWSPTDGLTESPYEYRHNKPAPRSIGQDGLPNHHGAIRAETTNAEASPPAGQADSPIVGNRRSRKFHAATCPLADTIAPSNRVGYGSADEARAAGLVPCRSCGGKPR